MEATTFISAKRTILYKLKESIDYSPKGSVDEPIRELVDYINSLDEFVTTSSCSGRVALYCYSGSPAQGADVQLCEDDADGPTEPRHAKAASSSDIPAPVSNKGAGQWLYVTHAKPELSELREGLTKVWPGSSAYVKVEPFILHVQCSGLPAARRLLQVAIRAGFRESGIVMGTEGKHKTLVHVRSTSGALEAPVRHEGVDIASESYIQSLFDICAARFTSMVCGRRERFEQELRKEFGVVQLQRLASLGPNSPAQPSKPRATVSQAQQHNRGTPTPSTQVTCNTCGQGPFPSKNAMYREHLQEEGGKRVCRSAKVASKARVHACDGCGKDWPSRNALFQHVRTCALAIALAAATKGVQSAAELTAHSSRALPRAEDYSSSAEARKRATLFLSKAKAQLTAAAEQAKADHQQGAAVLHIPPIDRVATLLKRYGHSSVYVPPTPTSGALAHAGTAKGQAEGSAGYVVVFGGTSVASGHARSGDLVLYDVATDTWLTERAAADAPSSGAGIVEVVGASRPQERTRAACTAVRLLGYGFGMLLFGGHNSPKKPLNDCWLLTIESCSVTQAGRVTVTVRWTDVSSQDGSACPSPRWCTILASKMDDLSGQVLVFGGRDTSSVLHDTWVGTLSVSRSGQGTGSGHVSLAWKKVETAPEQTPIKRFSHAACSVHVGPYSGVLMQGGYEHSHVEPTNPYAGRDDARADAWLWLWNAPAAAEAGPGSWQKVDVEGDVSIERLSRWSHALVALPSSAGSQDDISDKSAATTVLILGGQASTPQLNAAVALTLTVQNGHACAHAELVDPTVSNDSYAGWLRVPSASMTKLPATGYTYPLPNAHRIHPSAWTAAPYIPMYTRHTAVHIPAAGSTAGRVLMIGGGGVCFAFGSQFSSPCVIDVTKLLHKQAAPARATAQPSMSSIPEEIEAATSHTQSISSSATNAVLVPAVHANAIKTSLQEAGLYDWARKVGPVSTSSGKKMLGIPLLGSAWSWPASVQRLLDSGDACLAHADLPAFTGTAGFSSVEPRAQPAGHDSMKGGKHTLERMRESVRALVMQCIVYHPTLRRSLVGGSSHAMSVLLTDLFGEGSASDFPKKIEWVGDIAVLPSGSFVKPAWSHLLVAVGGLSRLFALVCQVVGADRLARHAEIHEGGTRASQVQMLHGPPAQEGSYSLPSAAAAGADVSIPMRTGHGALPWSVAQAQQAAKNLAAVDDSKGGWVTVRQGYGGDVTIQYRFDITRLMFSSGNVTEKARMGCPPGRARGQGETVADMYCGMGYFTLPLLLKAGATHVHAADWNPDAIACIQLNLALNKVSPGRVTLWPGDNAQLAQPGTGLVGQVDRVLLGLIPSSEQGWSTAVRLLRAERGGMLHVHQNVHERDMLTWTRTTLPEALLKLARQAGCAWAGPSDAALEPFIRVLHVEKVKSYAPQVWHVVVDVECGPALGPSATPADATVGGACAHPA